MCIRDRLSGVLKSLTPREEKVLRLRFGLEDGRPRTLEEVGLSLIHIFTLPFTLLAGGEQALAQKARELCRGKEVLTLSAPFYAPF